MIAPLLIAVAAAPILVAFWMVAWLIADLFEGSVTAHVPVRSRDGWGR
jgi:hypothetical protein